MRVAAHIWPLLALGAGAAAFTGLTSPAEPVVDARGMHLGAATLQSAGELTFGPDGTLFVADARAGALYAFDVGDAAAAPVSGGWQVANLDVKLAAALGATLDDIRFNDLATNPVSGLLYLSLSRGQGAAAAPVLARVNPAGRIDILDLGRIRFATTTLPAAPARADTMQWGQPKWQLSITDMMFADGQLWIAGLSNEQFASTLRRVPFPFTNRASLATVEIFHTSHNRFETQSPITAFTSLTIGGKPMVIAGYGCAPVALFDQSAVDAGKHLRGRTVAELGGGNAPIDMVMVPSPRNGRQYLLIANSDRTLMRFDVDSLVNGKALTTGVSTAYQPAGVPYLPIASAGIMQLAPFSNERMTVLRRDIQTGHVHLESYRLLY